MILRIVEGNSALSNVEGGEIGDCLLIRASVSHLGLHGADET